MLRYSRFNFVPSEIVIFRHQIFNGEKKIRKNNFFIIGDIVKISFSILYIGVKTLKHKLRFALRQAVFEIWPFSRKKLDFEKTVFSVTFCFVGENSIGNRFWDAH